MISFLRVTNEDGKAAYVRADEIGAMIPSKISVKPGPGRPSKDAAAGLKTVDCLTLYLRNGIRLHCRGETLESMRVLMKEALGTMINVHGSEEKPSALAEPEAA